MARSLNKPSALHPQPAARQVQVGGSEPEGAAATSVGRGGAKEPRWSNPFTICLKRNPTVMMAIQEPTRLDAYAPARYGVGIRFIVTDSGLCTITGMLRGGAAEQDGRLRVGDVLMAVDHVVLHPCSRPCLKSVASLLLVALALLALCLPLAWSKP